MLFLNCIYKAEGNRKKFYLKYMKSSFNLTATKPTGKYYIDFHTDKNSVNNSQAGRKFYNDLPEATYFARGVNGSNPGDAFLFCFDNGTCLLPICDTTTNKQVCIAANAGLQINNGKLEKA